MTANDQLELIAAASHKQKEREYWSNEVFSDCPSGAFSQGIKMGQLSGVHPELRVSVFEFDSTLVNQLTKISAGSDASLQLILMTAFCCLLGKQQNTDDVLIGTAAYKAQGGAAGQLLNTALAIRVTADQEMSFRTLLRLTGSQMKKALQHQNYPLALLVNQLTGSGSGTFGLAAAIEYSNLQYSVQESSMFADLLLTCSSNGSSISCTVTCNGAVYNEEDMTLFFSRYAALLQRLVSQPDEPVKHLSFLSDAEWNTCFNTFNDTGFDYGNPHQNIADVIQQRAASHPHATGLVWEGGSLSFEALNRKANQLAWNLRSRGIGPGSVVGIMVKRSPEMIAGIYGIVKAGAAYLPIDPATPAEGVSYRLQNSGSTLLLYAGENIPQQEGVTLIDLQAAAAYDFSTDNPPLVNAPGDTVYVIYTSGSTGLPKGAMIDNKAMLNRIYWMQRQYPLDTGDTILQKTNYTFDVSVWELFWGVFSGARLCLLEPGGESIPEKIIETVSSNKVTVMHFVPSMFAVFLEQVEQEQRAAALGSLRFIMASGEALSFASVNRFNRLLPGALLANLYGPTEATIDVSFYNCAKEIYSSSIPIGKPIDNIRLFITDRYMNLMGRGLMGELCIGGVGLAKGYIGNEALTAEKFVKTSWYGGLLYRTGDLASWLPDGTIMYHGRTDFQVKLRGYRIEPGEIEVVLCGHPAVQNAVVMVCGNDDADRRLVAYFTANTQVLHDELRTYLGRKLPAYMVPAVFMQLDAFPLTSSGKVNRKSLPVPDEGLLKGEDYTAPATVFEKKIAAVWEEELKMLRSGADDSFFDWGGDSIKAIRLVSRLRSLFGRQIKMPDLYRLRTIRNLAGFLEQAPVLQQDTLNRQVEEQLDAVKKDAFEQLGDNDAVESILPMSDIQSGMVYASVVNPGLAMYHDQFLYMLPGRVNPALFEQSLELMIEKHETLRTAFDLEGHESGLQLIFKTAVPRLDVIELAADGNKAENIIKDYIKQQRAEGFDFSKAPLWRAALFLQADRTLFLFQFHHAILDGWSVASFNTELNSVYKMLQAGESVPVLPALQCSQRNFIAERLAEKLNPDGREFWKQEMEDFRRIQLFEGNPVYERMTKVYSDDFFQQLRSRTAEDGVHIRTLFFAAFACALQLLSYEDECTVGLVTNNRPVVEDGDRLLGCFLNTIPVRLPAPAEAVTWKEFVVQTEQKLELLKGREGTTLMDIARAAGHKVTDGNPFFDAAFNFTNFHVYEEVLRQPQQHGNETTVLDELSYEITNTFLDLTANLTGNQLSLNYSLRRKLKYGKELQNLHHYIHRFLELYASCGNEPAASSLLFASAEKAFLEEAAHGPAVEDTASRSLIEMFAEQVLQKPDAAALVYAERKLSYRELDQLSDEIAFQLQQMGAGPGVFAGIFMERSEWMVAAILAIIKTGAGYVPLDPGYPQERINYMIQDAGLQLVITDESCRTLLPEQQGLKLLIANAAGTSGAPAAFIPVVAQPSDTVYVIYTSGSTGRPKGVMIPHSGLLNYLSFTRSQYACSSGHFDFPLFTSLSFDLTQTSVFLTLLSGGTLRIAGAAPVDVLLKDLLASGGINAIKLTPSHVFLLEGITAPGVEAVVIGGEALEKTHTDRLIAAMPNAVIYNEYGPTEATIGCTVKKVLPGEINITIGRPFSNTSAIITGKNGRLLSPGVWGELCIGGAGLASGYLNKPELTKEKFVPSPLGDGALVYRTGDMAKWLPGGELVCSGRIDEQVKIRGYRAEPGETEAVLLQCTGIVNAVVLAKPDGNGSSRLVAYVVADGDFNREQVIKEAGEKLPEYMIPSLWVQLESMPLTVNGKADRKALPDPDAAAMHTAEYVAPQTETEEILAVIWQQLLHIEKAGIHDDFFVSGGHSLLALRMLSSVNRKFGISLSFRTLFEFRTIAGLAAYIELVKGGNEMVPDEVTEVYEL